MRCGEAAPQRASSRSLTMLKVDAFGYAYGCTVSAEGAARLQPAAGRNT